MGVQILNKDVSVITNVVGKPKANISNILGTIGWLGGGVDVTPNPTPNWPDATADGLGASVFSAMVQITGITQDITMSISFTPTAAVDSFSYSNGTSSAFGSNTVTNLTTSPTSITVAPNNYLGFYLNSSYSTTRTITITNVSDSNTVLDTFTLTTTFDE